MILPATKAEARSGGFHVADESTSFTLLVKPEHRAVTLRDCDFTFEKRATVSWVDIFAATEEEDDETPLRVAVSLKTRGFQLLLELMVDPYYLDFYTEP